jgi:hypothetical protein
MQLQLLQLLLCCILASKLLLLLLLWPLLLNVFSNFHVLWMLHLLQTQPPVVLLLLCCNKRLDAVPAGWHQVLHACCCHMLCHAALVIQA